MSLLNPFTEGLEIKLPHQNTFPEYEEYVLHPYIFVQKMVLSASPYDSNTKTWNSNLVVMLICSAVGYLAFWRPNDQSWNRIETRNSVYADVAYHNGLFYAADHRGHVVVCDVWGPNPTVARVIFRFSSEIYLYKEMYMVEFSSPEKQSLLLVRRDNTADFPDEVNAVYGTTEFNVYELELDSLEKGHSSGVLPISPMKEIKSLGSRALFLGHSASMALEVSSNNNDNKLAPGIKPNHIYFTDDCWFGYFEKPEGGGKDMGVYNLETGTIEPLCRGEGHLLSRICPPIWITHKF